MATKCPCIREAMRKKYGENHIACCAKQEISTTGTDIIKKGVSTAQSILNSLTGGSGTPKIDMRNRGIISDADEKRVRENLKKNKIGGAKYKHGGAWTRNPKGSRRCM